MQCSPLASEFTRIRRVRRRGPPDGYPLEKITAYGVDRDVIEADSVELRKALQRRGQDIYVPADALRIDFADRYLTLPLIRHRTAASVGQTLDALGDLCDAWEGATDDGRALAFSISAPLSDIELRCSVYGHLKEIRDAVQSLRMLFASSLENVAAWVDGTSGALRGRSRAQIEDARFDAMMTPYETFRVTRKQIAAEDLQLEHEDGTIKHELRIPASDVDLVAAVRAGRVGPAIAWAIERSHCSRCSAPYADCPCSAVLDADVREHVDEAKIVYPFWTDRPR